MALESEGDAPSARNAATDTTVFTEWLIAIDTFHYYFTQLAPYIKLEQQYPGLTIVASQCPPDRAKALVDQMECTLESLINDLDTVDESASAPDGQSDEWLITHTHILNSLNQQAQVLLLLMIQTPT